MTEQVTPPSSPSAPEGAVPGPEAPAKKSGVGKKVLGIVGIIAVVLVVAVIKVGLRNGLFGLLNDDKTAEAHAGDCIANLPETKTGKETEANDAKVVDCDSSEAAYEVAGRLENKTQAEAKTTKECDQFFNEGDEYAVYYSIPDGGKGYILCLRPKA